MASSKKAVPAVDARRDMTKELAAATALKHQLSEAFGEERDFELLRDMVEGETNLDAAIDAVLAQMATDFANIQGIEKFEPRWPRAASALAIASKPCARCFSTRWTYSKRRGLSGRSRCSR